MPKSKFETFIRNLPPTVTVRAAIAMFDNPGAWNFHTHVGRQVWIAANTEPTDSLIKVIKSLRQAGDEAGFWIGLAEAKDAACAVWRPGTPMIRDYSGENI